VLASSDGSYNSERMAQLIKSPKVKIVIFRIAYLSSLLTEFKEILDLVKEQEKVLFVISRADSGAYESDEESKAALAIYPVAFGEDITVGAACGKCASLLGRVS